MWRLTRTARTSGNSAPTEDVHILSQSATDAPPPSIRQYSYLREMCRVIGTRLALRDDKDARRARKVAEPGIGPVGSGGRGRDESNVRESNL